MEEASETRSFPLKIGFLGVSFFFAQIPTQFHFHALLAMLNDEIGSERAFIFLSMHLSVPRFFFLIFLLPHNE